MGLSDLPTRTSTVKRGLMVRSFEQGPAQAKMGQDRRRRCVKITAGRCRTCILVFGLLTEEKNCKFLILVCKSLLEYDRTVKVEACLGHCRADWSFIYSEVGGDASHCEP